MATTDPWKRAQQQYGWSDARTAAQILTALNGYQLWEAVEGLAVNETTVVELVESLRARVLTGEFSDPP